MGFEAVGDGLQAHHHADRQTGAAGGFVQVQRRVGTPRVAGDPARQQGWIDLGKELPDIKILSSIKAVLVGGPSGGLLPPDLLDDRRTLDLSQAVANVGFDAIVELAADD